MNQRVLFTATGLPVLQNRVFESHSEAINCHKVDLELTQDAKTGLIYNATFDPSLLKYDRNYNNEQSLSARFDSHLLVVAQILSQRMGKTSFLEIGCGKGYFFNLLQSQGFDIVACDPTYEGNHTAVSREFYQGQPHLKRDNVVLRHVLEHIQDPFRFLSFVAKQNQGGRIYIEVPCLDWIVENYAWFDLFYEHVNYFRLCDLRNMFSTVIESGTIFGGQYLYIVADLHSLKQRKLPDVPMFEFPKTFKPKFPRVHRRRQMQFGAALQKALSLRFMPCNRVTPSTQ